MHVLFIGAHPDDCDFSCGGTAAFAARRGDAVKFVSITTGDRGHWRREYVLDRHSLAERRFDEARLAVSVFGGEFESLGIPDGEVYISPELTLKVVRTIRNWGKKGQGPDLVVTNRPQDYHRDHRYGAQTVLDAAYLLTVPLYCPDVRHMDRMPVIAHWFDGFREGGEFRPDVVVPIDWMMDKKTEIAQAHESQLFEWLPFNAGEMDPIPEDPTFRRSYAREKMEARGRRIAEYCRERAPGLVPGDCEYAEAYQISEYGRRPTQEELQELFPLTHARGAA